MFNIKVTKNGKIFFKAQFCNEKAIYDNYDFILDNYVPMIISTNWKQALDKSDFFF